MAGDPFSLFFKEFYSTIPNILGFDEKNRHGETWNEAQVRQMWGFVLRSRQEQAEMDPGKPSPTITTKCHSISNGRFGHYDVAQLRGISVREAATLQSFPDDYIFYPRDQLEAPARMIGNAVPPKLASFFAEYLVKSLEIPVRR